MFKFFSSKKELDITDALNKKRATITIGGESVVIEAFKLGKALELFAALGNATELVKLAGVTVQAPRQNAGAADERRLFGEQINQGWNKTFRH